MAAYCDEVHNLEDKFDGLELNHSTRRFNKVADELAKAASGRKPILDGIFVSDQYKPSIRNKEPGGVGNTPPIPDLGADSGRVGDMPPVLGSGTDPGGVGGTPPILGSGADPPNPEVMGINADLVAEPDPPPDWRGKALIQDIHAGACDHHTAPRTLVRNAFRQGFY
ncbi:uncharacterized protein LOC101761769 [Setaria italica]|uniref:uncharacterized protein LOC101761769 n=1 Tax=Setaria italica TaxID=4555 RepID=UPI000350BBDA|nr:uncharacterized protein LOC101761769 [Setaria italica]